MAQVVGKNAQGYGYKYTDLAAINGYVESIGETYYQEIETDERGHDYIVTCRCKDGQEKRIRGLSIMPAVLSGKSNPVQEMGAGLTYIRRYSLLMAYGLACEDNDAADYTREEPKKKATTKVPKVEVGLTEAHKTEIQNVLKVNNLDYFQVFTKPIDDVLDKNFDAMLKHLLDYIRDEKELPEAMR